MTVDSPVIVSCQTARLGAPVGSITKVSLALIVMAGEGGDPRLAIHERSTMWMAGGSPVMTMGGRPRSPSDRFSEWKIMKFQVSVFSGEAVGEAI